MPIKSKLTKTKLLSIFVGIAFLIGGTYFVVSLIQPKDLVVTWEKSNLEYLFYFGIAFFLNLMVYAWRWQWFFRKTWDENISFFRIYNISNVNVCANIFLPFRMGELSFFYYLKDDFSLSQNMASLITIRMVDAAIVGLAFLVSVIFVVENNELITFSVLIILTVSILVVFLVAFILIRLLPVFWKDKTGLRKYLSGWQMRFKQVANLPFRELAVFLLIGTFLFTTIVVVNYFALKFTDIHLTIVQTIFYSSGMTMISVLPIHGPLGLGTVESFTIVLLAAIGINLPEGEIAAGAIGIHLLYLLFAGVALAAGLIYLGVVKRSHKPSEVDH